MSDLQIITGFSILISGFMQLRCGLAAYYWLIIVELAWFSTITHMCCLTLLRSHLSEHTVERAWRTGAMAVLAVLLLVGLSFTCNYVWVGGYPDIGIKEPAICSFHVRTDWTTERFGTVIVSGTFIVVAFASRVVKMHKALSVDVFGRARRWLSIRMRQVLRFIFIRCCRSSAPHSLKRSLCYRPILAIFLTARLLLDGWSSVFSEVSSSDHCIRCL